MIWLALAGAGMAAPPNTAEVWASAGFEARVSDPVELELTQHVRLGSGPVRVTEVLTDAGGSVRLSDTWRVATAYRIGSKLKDDGRFFAHRAVLDWKGKWKLGRVKLDWRERYQLRLPAPDYDARHTLRSRLRASFDIDQPVTPRVAVEPFVSFGDGNGTGDGLGLPKVRFDVFFRVRLKKKRADLDVGYRLEEPIRDRAEPRLHVLSIGLNTRVDLRRDDD